MFNPKDITATNQLGALVKGSYSSFTSMTPINATNVYSIDLTTGIWLVESNVSYYANNTFTNMETLSLSTSTNQINTDIMISTPFTLLSGNIRCQRITGTFRITNSVSTVYTVFQANANGGSISNVTSYSSGSCSATRIG